MREAVLAVFAGLLGAVIGSFLNACIHRLPRGLSLDNPRRSFCPACGKTIPWHENLPIVSWLALRGKCSGCRQPISPRYPLVEALTAGLFLWAWMVYGWPQATVYWVLLAILVASTFIDFEHFIIPDELTLGGTAAGLVLSGLVPAIHGASSWWGGLAASLGGAAAGFAALWLVVEGGKLAFGRKAHRFAEPAEFRWTRDGDRADLVVAGDTLRWEDVFSRASDELILECTEAEAGGSALPPGKAVFRYDRVSFAGGPPLLLDELDEIRGRLTALVIPREAMGFGDVKFLAAIGAFIGWQGVLFTIFASSIVGCLAGLAGLFLARDRSGARLPFGPFLAAGAVWWLFGGRDLFVWYFGLFSAVF
ncbi:MAG: prepilin peptidase [Terrimicrobiaceae bacterium]|nr:prepilin peptidase [Terrimicrobiaceae bacterium]